MFSIFAARMFEQRVLQAYREKVAQERQLQLLRELEDEDKLEKEREAKKQNANQKKKDKKRWVFVVLSFAIPVRIDGWIEASGRCLASDVFCFVGLLNERLESWDIYVLLLSVFYCYVNPKSHTNAPFLPFPYPTSSLPSISPLPVFVPWDRVRSARTQTTEARQRIRKSPSHSGKIC